MRIIVAVEPSASSDWVEDALRAFPLLDPLDILLISALDIPRPPLTSPDRRPRRLYGSAIAGLRVDAQRAAEQVAESLQGRLATRAANVSAKIVDGRPVPAIVQAAASWGADLIITGSNGRNAVSRAILGSVSDEVVQSAPCPVLVAKRRVGVFQRVLAATDGSLHAEAALRFLARLPIPTSAEIMVCAVTERPPTLALVPVPTRGRRHRLLPLMEEMQRRAALQSIAVAQGIMSALSCCIRSSLRTGVARRELADEVDWWVPDLLVLGARGRTVGPHGSLGRVAKALLRGTRCPTLVVRAGRVGAPCGRSAEDSGAAHAEEWREAGSGRAVSPPAPASAAAETT
jgi:nucleotide-binding universal stress UspA family protein